MNGKSVLHVTAALALLAGVHRLEGQEGSLTVHEAVRRGLESHPRLGAARAIHDQATARLGVAKAARMPFASTEAVLTRFQEPMIVAPLHGFDISTPPLFERTLIQSRLMIDYTLFDGGMRGARIGQARAALATTNAEVASAEMVTISEIALAYLDLLTATDVDAANSRRLQAMDAERDRVAQMLEQGLAARVELLRVEAAFAQSRADQITGRGDLAVTRNTLARLIGMEARILTRVRIRPVGVSTQPPEGPLAARAREANPRLRQARQAAAIQHAAARAQRATWFPTVRLAGGLVTFGSTAGAFVLEWQGGLVVSYPLFTGGGRSNRVSQARAVAARADEDLRLAQLDVDEAVDKAVARLEESGARAEALAAAVDHFTEVVRIERLALSAGSGVQTDYLTAEAQLARARAELARARNAHVAARVALAAALGDLTLEWLAVNLESQP